LDDTFSTKNGREIEQKKNYDTFKSHGENLILITQMGLEIETDLENAKFEPAFLATDLSLNYESQHVNNVFNCLQNDYIRNMRNLKPCEVVNP